MGTRTKRPSPLETMILENRFERVLLLEQKRGVLEGYTKIHGYGSKSVRLNLLDLVASKTVAKEKVLNEC